MIKNALIVIDIQKCFVSERIKDLPARIKSYLEKNKDKYDFVIFTKFVNQPNSKFVKYLNWHNYMEADEIELVDELKTFINDNNIFEKESYSIFKSKKLLDFIDKNKIEKFFFCGLTSDGCVLASAFDSFDRGFETHIIKELTDTPWGDRGYNDLMIKILGYKIDPSLLKK